MYVFFIDFKMQFNQGKQRILPLTINIHEILILSIFLRQCRVGKH